MQWLRLALEIVVTLGGSFAVWLVTGSRLYAFVGLLMMLIMFGLVMTTRARKAVIGEASYDPLLEDHATPLWARLLLGGIWLLLMGFCWPVLPVVLAYRRLNDHVDGEAPKDNERL